MRPTVTGSPAPRALVRLLGHPHLGLAPARQRQRDLGRRRGAAVVRRRRLDRPQHDLLADVLDAQPQPVARPELVGQLRAERRAARA